MKRQNSLTTLLLKLKHNLHAISVNRASYVRALTPVERVLGHPSLLHSLFQCRHATLLPRFWGLEGAFRDDPKRLGSPRPHECDNKWTEKIDFVT